MRALLLWLISLFSKRKKTAEKTWEENRGHPYRDPWAILVPVATENVEKKVGKLARLIGFFKKKWNFKMSWNYSLPDTLFGLAGFSILFGVIALGFYSIFGAVLTPKTIDYCYVSYVETKEKGTDRETDKLKVDAEGNIIRHKYYLMGKVNWDNDRTLFGADNLEDVTKAAELLQCQIK